MTKGIQDFLNLPSMDDMIDPSIDAPSEEEAETPSNTALAPLDPSKNPLTNLEGKDHAEAMDTIYEETLKHGKDLVEFGYNADPAKAKGYFDVAAVFYRNAMDAKNSKRDAELKAMKLALDLYKAKGASRDVTPSGGTGTPAIPQDEVIVVEDRNEILRRLKAQNEEDDK